MVPHEGMWHDSPLDGRTRVCFNPKACRADTEDRCGRFSRLSFADMLALCCAYIKYIVLL